MQFRFGGNCQKPPGVAGRTGFDIYGVPEGTSPTRRWTEQGLCPASASCWSYDLGKVVSFSEPTVTVRINWDDMCPGLLGACLAHSSQETGAAPPQGTAQTKRRTRQALAHGSSQCMASRGTCCWFVPLLVILTCINGLRWYLPVFFIAKLINKCFIRIN